MFNQWVGWEKELLASHRLASENCCYTEGKNNNTLPFTFFWTAVLLTYSDILDVGWTAVIGSTGAVELGGVAELHSAISTNRHRLSGVMDSIHQLYRQINYSYFMTVSCTDCR